MDNRLEKHNSQSYHYEIVGLSKFKQILKTLCDNLPYYRFNKTKKRKSKEIFYDIPSHLLADGGIAISKWTEDGQSSLTVRKIFSVKELNKPSEKFFFGYCKNDEQPKDYSYQMALLIEKTFSTPFSVDLESLIKQTTPIIEVDITADKYEIICGTGYRAIMQYENIIYKDVKTGKKVETVGVTFKFPIDDRKEKDEILNTIERRVKALALNNISRFEIAKKLLFTKPEEISSQTEENDDNEE